MKRMCGAFTKVCVWMVVIVTAIPAPLMAQTLGGSGFQSLGGVGGAGSGTKDVLPGSPVLTNPTALQPLAPPQTPCPPPPAKTPPAIAPTGPTLNDFLAGGFIRSAASFGRYENQTGTGRAL